MSEPKPVPESIKAEAASLESERTEQQLMESLLLVQQLMIANHMLDQNAKALAAGLIEIQNINGNPPIQVARTIAERTINSIVEEMTKSYEQESKTATTNGDPILPGPIYSPGHTKHETKHIPGTAHGRGDGKQGDSI